jgi:2,4-dienoyl-CoA reductase-like NADH-dependent reductase (Old Yellow Enzyme family)/thioredoxin reductase
MNYEVNFKGLFEPGKIGTMELRNRLLMPPMCTRLCGLWGEVTDALIEWYVRRARGGAGLIVVEVTHTATAQEPLRFTTRMPRADDDSYFPGLFQLAEAVHDAGAKIGIQLTVGTGIRAGSGPWIPLGREYLEENVLIAPSEIASPMVGRRVREITIEEIGKMVQLIGHAAKRVKQVGFDAIEINAHGGYLISEFISPYFNKRPDQYGGNLDGRLRFLLEIIDSIRENVGPEFPLIVKYAIAEAIDGGRDVKEGQIIAQRLQHRGVNAISVSVGSKGAKWGAMGSMYFPEGYMTPLAEALKEVIQIPVILSGRLGNPVLADKVLKEGKADFIGLGRPLIADPDWPKKVAEGRVKHIRQCIACNDCSKVAVLSKGPLRCAVNATAGREREYESIVPAERVKKVVIIGAGPAGMEAARVAALRGHRVTLYERTNELGGGQLKLASVPPHKEVLKYIVDYYSEMFKGLNNIQIKLGETVTAQDIVKEKPDAVIVATGAEPLIPEVPGCDKANVATVFDVVAGKARVNGTAIVVGGGSVGCETANFLAKQGKQVTIVEMQDFVPTDMERRVWLALSDELSKFGVGIITGVKLDAVTNEGAIVIDKNRHKTLLKAEKIVLACGMKPANALAKEFSVNVKELYIIGDAKQPRTIRNAISDGYIVAHDI